MKKTILFLFTAFTFYSLNAQKCNAIFFSQDGQKFQVILNGVLQNLDYETNVKVTDLNFEGKYKVTINFEDNQYASVDKSIYMVEQSTEYTYNIKKHKKGHYVMRAMSFVPIAQAPKPAPTQTVIVYSTTPPTQTVTQTVSTSTTTNTGHEHENVSMGVNVGNVGMNVNISVNDGGATTGTSTTTTTYSETTTTSTSHSGGTTAPTQSHYVMPGYGGPIGCPYPMSNTDFNSAKQSISSKSFSDSKLTLAKQITKSNCLTSDQAKQIIQLFDFEATRLEYAKFAYGHTYDLGNYYKVNDVFDFESTIEELNTYIEGK